MLPLSVLDLSPVVSGVSGAVSLRNSLDLAQLADRLGYTRYWVAEHHNLPSIASSAPDIMIGQIAALTTRMRIGSGGVMLPNHAPLMVAERFKVLEALFPGRIDLGLGRAPGTDPVTSYALRRRQDNARRFPRALPGTAAVREPGLSGRPSVPQHPRHAGRRPAAADLAARLERLQRAARRHGRHGVFLRLPFLRPRSARRRCWPTASSSSRRRTLEKPYAILGVAAVCADSDAEADRLASTIDLNFVRRRRGEYVELASPEEALAYPYAPAERGLIARNRSRLIVGSKATVRARLRPLAEATRADEVMITTMIYDHGRADIPTNCWRKSSDCVA